MTKNKLKIISAFLTLLALQVSPVFSQDDATNSADLDTIKENVKKRIQEVVKVKGDVDITKRQVAYFGLIKQLANTTISIESADGVKLASTSSTTTFIHLPDSRAVKLEDLAIDDYVIALGMVDESEVLISERVITQSEPPKKPANDTYFGRVVSYDPKKYNLVVKNDSLEDEKNFTLGRKTVIQYGYTDGTKDDIKRTDAIPADSSVLIIYTPSKVAGEDLVPVSVLIKPLPGNETSELKATPSATPRSSR